VREGPACQIARLLPTRVPLPASWELGTLLFTYTRVTSSNTWLVFAGTWQWLPPAPYVGILGPNVIAAEEGDPFVGEYQLVMRDLHPPLTVVWGSANAAQEQGVNATMVWNIPGLRVGASARADLLVIVIDADGRVLTARKQVLLKRVEPDPVDPICLAKPWLPECQ
jgi:hypothetical protein